MSFKLADLKEAMKLAERREALAKYQVKCTKCASDQVQLIRYDTRPARWRCRMCKWIFDLEPLC